LLGLETINHDKFQQLKNCKVLIRAHGEPPETYITAAENNISIIEATCPIVKRLQSRIKDTWVQNRALNAQIVIFGKPGHAEVVGLLGQIHEEGILVSEPSDIDKIDITRPVYLFAQTTMGIKAYYNFADILRKKMELNGISDIENFLKVNRTVCGQVSSREPHLKEFAARHEAIVFVSGRESSNGRMLYSICKSINPDTHFVSSPEEIEKKWFRNKKSVGICGATSTPKWLIEKIRDIISNI
jgi:4-hydroxy-3-methylbut-2-enyl diphosphate reductase